MPTFLTPVTIGVTPATTGTLRLSDLASIWWRNAANTANVSEIQGDSGIIYYDATTGYHHFRTGAAYDGALRLGSTEATFGGTMWFGFAQDTNLYRSAANVLKTDDSFIVAGAALQFGVGTFLNQPDATGGQWLLGTKVTADTIYRYFIEGDTGKTWWGAGGSTAVDTNLYRGGVNVLKTDDDFVAASLTAATGTFSGTLTSPSLSYFAAAKWGVD